MSKTFPAPSQHPTPSLAALQLQYIGKNISEVAAPAAIVDAAVVRRNCKLMLETASELGLGFRAHVKTHKTVEIAKLQVGEDTDAVKLVCSTVSEIESLAPWLLECKSKTKSVNVLYGVPLPVSQITRLRRLAQVLGQGTIGLFVDHPSHIKHLDGVSESIWPGAIPVWINIDVGYHREGVAAGSAQLKAIAHALSTSKRTQLAGLYTHFGSSYGSSSPEEALEYMVQELQGLKQGAESFLEHAFSHSNGRASSSKVVLSLGATPTATATQNLLGNQTGSRKYLDLLMEIQQSFELEIHAGVYPFLDMQQLATRARPADISRGLSYSDIGLRILAEVASVYIDRGPKLEALIAAGSIALGREPCKSYDGWAVVTPWQLGGVDHYDPKGSQNGWIVGRISQEHGILVWEGSTEHFQDLKIGQRILLWPNHACIAGVNFGWYLIVDSDTDDADVIRDVWIRSRGW